MICIRNLSRASLHLFFSLLLYSFIDFLIYKYHFSVAFSGTFKSPGGITAIESPTPKAKETTDDDNDRYVEDDHDPCPDFKPVIPLPEKVEVRTGEEDEEVVLHSI